MKDFAHQTEIFKIAKEHLPYYGLLMEQGTGKTRIAIQLAEFYYKRNLIQAVLVLTTKGLVRNWSDIELPAHSSIPYDCWVWPKKMTMTDSRIRYWLVNIDAIITDSFTKTFREFYLAFPNFMCIVDESTIIKTPGAKRTRRAWKIGALAKSRLIMTGVPTPRSPLDLYAQCRFLSPAALGFPDFQTFKYRYAEIEMRLLGSGKSYPEIKSYKNLGELKERLTKFTSIIKREECLDLPINQHRIFPVPLSVEQRKAYDELRTQFTTIVKGETVSAAIVVAMINKCLQICSGQIRLPDGIYVEIPNERAEVLQELCDEADCQTIVWTAFVSNAVTIGRQFGKKALLLPSGLTLDKRQEILERFKSGEGQILVANPASAGHGLTLTNSWNVIHYSRSFNYEHRAQSEARVTRIGQVKSCLFTDLCDPTTMEKGVINVLSARERMSDFMLDRNFLLSLMEEPEEEYA